jgi:hypothetical protein
LEGVEVIDAEQLLESWFAVIRRLEAEKEE